MTTHPMSQMVSGSLYDSPFYGESFRLSHSTDSCNFDMNIYDDDDYQRRLRRPQWQPPGQPTTNIDDTITTPTWTTDHQS